MPELCPSCTFRPSTVHVMRPPLTSHLPAGGADGSRSGEWWRGGVPTAGCAVCALQPTCVLAANKQKLTVTLRCPTTCLPLQSQALAPSSPVEGTCLVSLLPVLRSSFGCQLRGSLTVHCSGSAGSASPQAVSQVSCNKKAAFP
jgi:hypothetical protein